MRDYEIVYIFRSSLTSEEIEAKLERYRAIIAGDGLGEITASSHWGKRQLAYPIRKQKNGYYVVVQFTSDPAPLTDLERALKLEDDVLRYLIVISERPLPAPEEPPEESADGPADPAESAETPEDQEAPAAEAAEEEVPEDSEAEDSQAEDSQAEDSQAEDSESEDAEAEAPEDEGSREEGRGSRRRGLRRRGLRRRGLRRRGLRGRSRRRGGREPRGTGRGRRRRDEGGLDGLSKGVPILRGPDCPRGLQG
ncbi:30S ribosomal protein S6 [Candidatus Palauibacter sp.]|uniref:30S ribosomal protein S6 n=1 Tax=Candidatus Palauibacter sp. TaxID=3101350 RepID=UPI003AF2F830